jgi:polysaccharide biosynthesis/export protein
MKKNCPALLINFFPIFALFILFTSCRSSKDLSYMYEARTKKQIAGAPVPSSPYKIQPNDNLYVSIISPNTDMNEIYNPATVGNLRTINNIWQNLPGQYVQGYSVSLDGIVNLPSVGKIPVVGLTIPEAEAKIQAKAQEYLKDVTAKVRLLNYKVTVMGEVTSPGVYYNYNFEFTVLDAISSASGTTNASDLEKVLVLRRTPTGTETFLLNLRSDQALSSPAYLLQPNDVVLVQPSKYKNVQLRLPVYSAALSTIAAIFLALNFFANN